MAGAVSIVVMLASCGGSTGSLVPFNDDRRTVLVSTCESETRIRDCAANVASLSLYIASSYDCPDDPEVFLSFVEAYARPTYAKGAWDNPSEDDKIRWAVSDVLLKKCKPTQ